MNTIIGLVFALNVVFCTYAYDSAFDSEGCNWSRQMCSNEVYQETLPEKWGNQCFTDTSVAGLEGEKKPAKDCHTTCGKPDPTKAIPFRCEDYCPPEFVYHDRFCDEITTLVFSFVATIGQSTKETTVIIEKNEPIVIVHRDVVETKPTITTEVSKTNSSALSTAAAAGIGVASTLGVAAIVVIAVAIFRVRRYRRYGRPFVDGSVNIDTESGSY